VGGVEGGKDGGDGGKDGGGGGKDGGGGGVGGVGGGGYGAQRSPQSLQSVPNAQCENSAPGPPSLQEPGQPS